MAKATKYEVKTGDFSKRGSKKKNSTLGSGARFSRLKKTLAVKPGVTDPGALAATIGRKKYGNTRFSRISKSGK